MVRISLWLLSLSSPRLRLAAGQKCKRDAGDEGKE